MDWKEVELSEVLVQYNKKITIDDSIEYKQVTVSKTGDITLREVKKGSLIGTKKQNIAQKGWFVYSRLGFHDGAFGIIPEELDNSIVTGDMPLFKIKDNILPEFLIKSLNLKEFKQQVKGINKGTAQTRIRENKFLKFKICLPDIDTQKIILKEYRKFEEKSKDFITQIINQEYYIKRLKEQILQDAIQGKLTKQNDNDEPASILLEKIKKEKEQLIKEKKIKKEKSLNKINEKELPFEIPKNWIWCKLGLIGLFERGKSKHRPRNDLILFKDGKYPFIQTGDVSDAKNNSFRIRRYTKTYNEVGLKQSKIWTKGTFCITIAANIAEVGYLDFDACFPDSVVAFINLTNEESLIKYLQYFIQVSQKEIEKFAPSTAQKNINLGIINDLNFPLPPLNEQKRIVETIEEKMKQIDLLEKEVQGNKLTIEKLKRAKLQELFSNNKEIIKREEVILN